MNERTESRNGNNGHGALSPMAGMRPMASQHMVKPAMQLPVMAMEDGGRSRLQGKKLADDKARARTLARAQAVAEKLSSATSQVASAVTEATSTVEQLGKAMQMIADGAEEAAAAAEESRAAINQIEKGADRTNQVAEQSLKTVEALYQLSRTTSAEIETLIKGVSDAAQASFESAKMIMELERQSEEIGKIVHAVARIADQTNLLALNAAIEAARAGDHGKGFAVVADEVRNLAEMSEKSARGIQDVVIEIQGQVKVVSGDAQVAGQKGLEEAEKAKKITIALVQAESDLSAMREGCRVISVRSHETVVGAKEYLKGAVSIATAAEQSATAVQEAQRSVQEQSRGYEEMDTAANSLAQISDTLKTSTNAQKSAEELATAAEELSANAEEIKSASSQISAAIEEISRSAQASAKACDEAVDVGNKLEASTQVVSQQAEQNGARCSVVSELLATNKIAVEAMISSIGHAAETAIASAKNVRELEERTRRIDKIVDSIVMVTVQTRMLAVNGNVEAARAGEFGRGFSVVAGDIRSLANESSENAERIKDLVKGVQTQIAKVVADIESGGVKARSESARAQLSATSLDRMATEIRDVEIGVAEILRGAEESVAALQQASKATVQISTAAQEMSRSSEESAAASEQGLKAAEEILQAVEEIASQADELQNG